MFEKVLNKIKKNSNSLAVIYLKTQINKYFHSNEKKKNARIGIHKFRKYYSELIKSKIGSIIKEISSLIIVEKNFFLSATIKL